MPLLSAGRMNSMMLKLWIQTDDIRVIGKQLQRVRFADRELHPQFRIPADSSERIRQIVDTQHVEREISFAIGVGIIAADETFADD